MKTILALIITLGLPVFVQAQTPPGSDDMEAQAAAECATCNLKSNRSRASENPSEMQKRALSFEQEVFGNLDSTNKGDSGVTK